MGLCLLIYQYLCYYRVRHAVVAQLVERIHGKDEVRGSNPRDGSTELSSVD